MSEHGSLTKNPAAGTPGEADNRTIVPPKNPVLRDPRSTDISEHPEDQNGG